MPHVDAPEAACRVGLARRDVTPPVGMYHRMWGAAAHDVSTGVHRPLTATAMVMAPTTGPPRAVVALDHCLFWKPEAEALLAAAAAAGVPADRVTVFFSHTHAAGLVGMDRVSLPGGHLIPAYLRMLGEQVCDAIREALAAAEPATITFGRGRCDLATNRDFIDPDGRAVCGFNPAGVADDAVLVGRVTATSGRVLGTVVNYACHPTTLAWENTLVSPDYVGAMRDVVEPTGGPCVFVQGASGDIGPRHGYVGDVSVADRNGRQLGYAVLSALEALPPPGVRFNYTGPVVSGATLGRWDYVPRPTTPDAWNETVLDVRLPYRADLRSAAAVGAERDRWLADPSPDARAMAERCARYLTRVQHLPPGDVFPLRVPLWRVGDSVWVALDGEHYNALQRRLRERFPELAVVVGTVANGSNVWYVPAADAYGKGLYQEEVSVVARGSSEALTDVIADGIAGLVGPGVGG